MDSPAFSSTSRRGSFDSDEDLDAYFASYVPLSNLPTPPLAKRSALNAVYTKPIPEDVVLTSDLAGPAIYLANLVPSNACVHRPSVATIHDFLFRAELSLEIIGLAACILDALGSRFAPEWRKAYSSTASTSSLLNRSWKKTPFHHHTKTSVEPEIVVLCALSLAAGYLDDSQKPVAYWARTISADRFTTKQVNATRLCILVDIDYSLYSFTPDMIQEAMEDMQRAEHLFNGQTTASTACYSKEERAKPPVLTLQGTAVLMHGLYTPEPSPESELSGVPSALSLGW